MKSARIFLVFLTGSLLPPSLCLSQSLSPRDSAVISVEELTMPHKAVQAFQKGTALLMKGELQASIPYFQTAIELAPTNYRTYHNLALAEFRLGKLDEAAANFQKSIEFGKDSYAPSYFGMALVLYKRSEFAAAEPIIQRGLAIAPGSALGKYCLALVQYSLNRLSEAQRSANDALKLDDHEVDAYLLLAVIDDRLHNPYAVIADLQNYLKLAPNGNSHPGVMDLLHRAQSDVASLSASVH